MIKAIVIGKNCEDILPVLKNYDFELTCAGSENFIPELIIAHGGDGTLLQAEREYPNIPKLALRDMRTAPTCEEHSYETILNNFFAGKLKLKKLPKLYAEFQGKKILAVNDIYIHNFERMSALRYRVFINDELYAKEVVGDGVGLSSIHGSTAYYKSITHSIFKTGIGLSFSNSTEEVNHLVLPETSIVRVEIVRGPGLVISDNSPKTYILEKDEAITLGESDEFLSVYGLESFMCPKCRILRHPNKSPYQGYIAP